MIKKTLTVYLPIVMVSIMFLLIFFGDKGLMDLKILETQKMQVVQQNEALVQENLSFHQTVMRLKDDPAFIEHVARKDLGLIKAEEWILKLETIRGKKPEGEGRQ